MEVSQAIRLKRAVRSFTPQPLPEPALRSILNAGRRAQSAKNRQAWHFLVIRDRQSLEGLSKLGKYAGHLAGAAAAIGILTPDPAERWSIMFDAGQAAAYMQLAAWEQGIGSCPATIYLPEEARKLLGVPADLHLRVMFSFGYPADPVELTAPPQRGGRKPLVEVVSFEHWQDASR
ncbi:MAG TPA: nitroreductase family protein [Anaerolineales bacterium]